MVLHRRGRDCMYGQGRASTRLRSHIHIVKVKVVHRQGRGRMLMVAHRQGRGHTLERSRSHGRGLCSGSTIVEVARHDHQ